MSNSCPDCDSPYPLFFRTQVCSVCHDKKLCGKCADKLVLEDGKHGLDECVTCACRDCFAKISSIDFDRTYEELGKDDSPPVVMVHGSGGSRKMWNPELLSKISKTHKVYLVDLPGHGSRMSEKLSLQSALDSLISFHRQKLGDQPAAYIGNSLGAYCIMGLIGKAPELVGSALLAGCAQNTCSADSSWKAAIGLAVMNSMSGMLSNHMLMKALLSQVPKEVSQELMETTFLRAGAYFSTSSAGSVEILRHVNPAESLPKAKDGSRIWFVTGELDHHDSLNRWAELTGGRAIVYQGVDHFFSHDSRSINKWHSDVLEFLQESNSL